jgi:hypothetical protein
VLISYLILHVFNGLVVFGIVLVVLTIHVVRQPLKQHVSVQLTVVGLPPTAVRFVVPILHKQLVL